MKKRDKHFFSNLNIFLKSLMDAIDNISRQSTSLYMLLYMCSWTKISVKSTNKSSKYQVLSGIDTIFAIDSQLMEISLKFR